MKKFLISLLVVMLCASASLAETPDVIAYTEYTARGWEEFFAAGCIDSRGNLYATSLESVAELPSGAQDTCAYLFENDLFENIGTYEGDLEALRSLAAGVQPQEIKYASPACDAGTEMSYAVRGGEWILVGASGDDMYENTTPTAQAIYKLLRDTFRGRVKSYFGEAGIAPEGFKPVDVLSFLGYPDADIENAAVTAVVVECEAGLQPYALSEAQIAKAKAMALGTVTGKHSNIFSCGNTMIYTFSDAEGNTIAAMEIYDGLLVGSDGMYEIAY